MTKVTPDFLRKPRSDILGRALHEHTPHEAQLHSVYHELEELTGDHSQREVHRRRNIGLSYFKDNNQDFKDRLPTIPKRRLPPHRRGLGMLSSVTSEQLRDVAHLEAAHSSDLGEFGPTWYPINVSLIHSFAIKEGAAKPVIEADTMESLAKELCCSAETFEDMSSKEAAKSYTAAATVHRLVRDWCSSPDPCEGIDTWSSSMKWEHLREEPAVFDSAQEAVSHPDEVKELPSQASGSASAEELLHAELGAPTAQAGESINEKVPPSQNGSIFVAAKELFASGLEADDADGSKAIVNLQMAPADEHPKESCSSLGSDEGFEVLEEATTSKVTDAYDECVWEEDGTDDDETIH